MAKSTTSTAAASGALKFLKNIILLPGCGQFRAETLPLCFAQPGSDELVGAVLTSEVAPGVGHTTQICVLPGYQGHGLGRMLMQTSGDDAAQREIQRRCR